MKIVRAKDGSARREVPLEEIKVPDLWHLYLRLRPHPDAERVLDCWSLCHDLLNHIKEGVANGTA